MLKTECLCSASGSEMSGPLPFTDWFKSSLFIVRFVVHKVFRNAVRRVRENKERMRVCANREQRTVYEKNRPEESV